MLTIGTFNYCVHNAAHVQCSPLPIKVQLLDSGQSVPDYINTLLHPAMVYISLTIGLTAGVSSLVMYCISTLGLRAPCIRGLQVLYSIVALVCFVYPLILMIIMYKYFGGVTLLSVEFGSFFSRCLIAVACSACLAIVTLITSPNYVHVEI